MSRLEPRSVEHVDVFRNDERVGAISRTSQGSRFEFDAAFFEAHRTTPGGIAQHLPFSRRVTETVGVNLHSYFAGLLPEGLRLRSLIARVKSSADDLFSLLVASGRDCVGDLFVVRKGETPDLSEGEPLVVEKSSFAELFQRSLDSDAAPLVAGVQDKLSPSTLSMPVRGVAGKRWLLKLNPPDKARVVENEYFFMRMARACGLDVAAVRLVHDRDGVSGLLVERFDRLYDRETRRWRGVHQEDACQLLDRYPADKYRLSTREILESLEACASPTAERVRMLELVAFSYLIGNGDLHGKNLSIGTRGEGLQLTPAYDLLSTRPYQDLHLALKVEGRADHVKRKHLTALSERVGVPALALELRLDRMGSRAAAWVPRLKEIGLDVRQTKLLTELMTRRLADLSALRRRVP